MRVKKALHRSRVTCLFLFVLCPSSFYVVVAATPNNILSDIIFSYYMRIHPKVCTFFTSPPADVICVIMSRKKTVSSLYQVDVLIHHARNEKHFNSTTHNHSKNMNLSDLLLLVLQHALKSSRRQQKQMLESIPPQNSKLQQLPTVWK